MQNESYNDFGAYQPKWDQNPMKALSKATEVHLFCTGVGKVSSQVKKRKKKGRFCFTYMWKIGFSTALFRLSLSILVSTFFPENQLNYPSWNCPFMVTVWFCLREGNQTALFQLLSVNE